MTATPEKSRSLSSSGSAGGIPGDIDAVMDLLTESHYVADRSLATAVFLSLRLSRPLFLEGEAGVGKTEIAKVLAAGLGRRLVRLQCYEGMDVASAVYEWNYPRQMIELKRAEIDRSIESTDLYDERFLIKRPIMQALSSDEQGSPVLLIDELDRADEPFEAFLLEILSDYQVTVPEIGTVRADQPPVVVITSNRTREIHDAIKRRCFYYWVDYPDAEREKSILDAKVPGLAERLADQVVAFVQALRELDLFKSPGVAETLDWAQALNELNVVALDPDTVHNTVGVLLKYQDDIARLQSGEATRILKQIQAELAVVARDPGR